MAKGRWGGCLTLLAANDAAAVIDIIDPLVGNSVLLVRSTTSWHAVSPVVKESKVSRRSMTVTFYRSDAVSSLWPPKDITPLHTYET